MRGFVFIVVALGLMVAVLRLSTGRPHPPLFVDNPSTRMVPSVVAVPATQPIVRSGAAANGRRGRAPAAPVDVPPSFVPGDPATQPAPLEQRPAVGAPQPAALQD